MEALSQDPTARRRWGPVLGFWNLRVPLCSHWLQLLPKLLPVHPTLSALGSAPTWSRRTLSSLLSSPRTMPLTELGFRVPRTAFLSCTFVTVLDANLSLKYGNASARAAHWKDPCRARRTTAAHIVTQSQHGSHWTVSLSDAPVYTPLQFPATSQLWPWQAQALHT